MFTVDQWVDLIKSIFPFITIATRRINQQFDKDYSNLDKDLLVKTAIENPDFVTTQYTKLFQDTDFLIWLVINMQEYSSCRNDNPTFGHIDRDERTVLTPLIKKIQPIVRKNNRGDEILATMILFLHMTFYTDLKYGTKTQFLSDIVGLAFLCKIIHRKKIIGNERYSKPYTKHFLKLVQIPQDMRTFTILRILNPQLFNSQDRRHEEYGYRMTRCIHTFLVSKNIKQLVVMYNDTRDLHFKNIHNYPIKTLYNIAFVFGTGTSTIPNTDGESQLSQIRRYLIGGHALRPIHERLLAYLHCLPNFFGPKTHKFVKRFI